MQSNHSKLYEYLATRNLEIAERERPLEITEDAEMLANVAGVWKGSQNEIRLVIQARCDKLREKLIATDLPYETIVSRQCLVELGGILEDFENIFNEFSKREEGKGAGGTEEEPEKGD